MSTPLPAELLWATLAAASILVAVLLVVLLAQRALRHRRERHRAALDARLRSLVLAATVAEDDELEPLLARVEALSGPERAHVGRASSQMLRDITGEAADRLRAVAAATGVVPRYEAATRSRDAVRRADAAEALGLLAPEGALERLQALALDPSAEVRTVAIRALGGFADAGATGRIVESLRTGSGVPASVATTALLQQGASAGERVRAALEDDDPGVRRGAARVAGLLQAPGCAPLLVALLDDDHDSVRIAAMRSLERIATRDALEPLTRAALSGGFVGEAAAATLAAMPSGWTSEALALLARDAERGVRRAAGLPAQAAA